MEKVRYIILKDGEKCRIVGEDGKYWITETGRLRKLNESILRVEEAQPEEEPKKAPAKRASRKKKAAEE